MAAASSPVSKAVNCKTIVRFETMKMTATATSNNSVQNTYFVYVITK